MTIARNVRQWPVFYSRHPQARLGYVGSDNSPLNPFGFGLSYTSFGYGKPVIDPAAISRGGSARVSVAITNTRARAGDEVVQMYVHPRVSSVAQPVVRLAGFERVSLQPGETKSVSFMVGPEQLAILNRAMQRVVEAGVTDVSVGPDVIRLQSVAVEVTP